MNLGNFEKMKRYVHQLNENTQEGAFLRAVLAIKNNEFREAFNYVNKVKENLYF